MSPADFERLAGRYEPLNFYAVGDLETWRRRQRVLGVADDGLPGPATCAAIRAFQRSHGFDETGITDPLTRIALDAVDARTGCLPPLA